MWILTRSLQEREREGRPVRVAIAGAGFFARGVAAQLTGATPGISLVAISSRNPVAGQRVFAEAGAADVPIVESACGFAAIIERGGRAVVAESSLLCGADAVDCVIEATGNVDHGARFAVAAIEAGKHLVLANAAVDALLGPLLKRRADSAGVVYTGADGDEPGVAMGLIKQIQAMGLRPVAAGNIKGFLDRARTPDTQRAFAESVGQRPRAVTSYADGTKLSMECTQLANATGFGIVRRGMLGPRCEHVRDLVHLLPERAMLDGGIVDFALGAQPGSGAFAIGWSGSALCSEYFQFYKVGDGPFYCLYTPFHLPHAQVAFSAARAVLFGEPTVAPVGAPRAQVVSMAKRDLRAGNVLDGIGGYACYGAIELWSESRSIGALPIALADGARLLRDVGRDRVIRFEDVAGPPDSLALRLYREQERAFS
jgi:predicted homoserine dehydrogenase-like protein